MTEIAEEEVPFWEKGLDDYPDDIIVRARQSGNGWYAVLDSGFGSGVGDPDFSTYGGTREQAVANCARTVRNDAKGIGKFAPHSILVQPYSLHFQLCKHWELKQRAVAAGMDPHDFMAQAVDAGRNWPWKLEGPWLEQCAAHSQLEAFAMVVVREMDPLLQSGEDLEIAAIEARSKFAMLVRDETKGIRTTGETMLELERRVQERVTELAPETMTP